MRKDKIVNKNINPLDVLTPNQKQFVQLHGNGLSKIQAYKQAYNKEHYTNSQASIKVYQVLNNIKIQAALNYVKSSNIKSIEDETSYKVSITKVLNEFSKIAFANVKDLFNEDGTPKQINEISNELTAAIKDIRTIEDKSTNKIYTEIKLHSKVDALINIAKHLGFYEVDNLQSKAQINIANLDSNDLVKLLEIQNKVQ